jgi:hypothetical protein
LRTSNKTIFLREKVDRIIDKYIDNVAKRKNLISSTIFLIRSMVIRPQQRKYKQEELLLFQEIGTYREGLLVEDQGLGG